MNLPLYDGVIRRDVLGLDQGQVRPVMVPRDNKWWFPTAFSTWDDEENEAIARVLDSGRFTMGPEVEAFEREFADYHGMKHGIMVNSGSSANLVMIAALFELEQNRSGISRGDQVIVPAIAWSTTYAPLVQYGLKLSLVDVDHSWNADPLLEAVEEPALIVGCSVLGNPCPAASWETIAGVTGGVYVEDNCESLGAFAAGSRTGTCGLMNTFSFFYSHQISAIEGGMILTNDDECAKLCRMLRAHGWSRDVEAPKTFSEEYDFRVFGYNVRPLEMHAAIARVQLRKLDAYNVIRRANLEMFRELVKNLPIELPTMTGRPAPFGLAFALRELTLDGKPFATVRDDLVHAFRAQGIDCRLPTGGSFRLHKYGALWANQETPNADRIHRTGLFLGNGALDLSAQITKAAEIMQQVLT